LAANLKQVVLQAKEQWRPGLWRVYVLCVLWQPPIPLQEPQTRHWDISRSLLCSWGPSSYCCQPPWISTHFLVYLLS